jgi:hypothetical protein
MDSMMTATDDNFNTSDNNGTCSEFDSTTHSSSPLHCTFAVTGRTDTFQAIYLCKTCSSNDSTNLQMKSNMCCCEGCAEQCHKDHDGLEFVGMGLAYCDCNQLHMNGCCTIINESSKLAITLGLTNNSISTNNTSNTQHLSYHLTDSTNIVDEAAADSSPSYTYLRESYMIDTLQDSEYCFRLQSQAQTLVQHSKDTFWIDINDTNNATEDESVTSLCDLELLARSIVQYHIRSNTSLLNILGNNEKDNHGAVPISNQHSEITVGGEWWVQVKSISHEEHKMQTESSVLLSNCTNRDEAVDLHYDKDEVLAESFGLGCFPIISTVTYLTDSKNASPTVIFNIRYDESSVGPEQSKTISEMLISYPECGKHTVFDGRLLHGAPSHYALRRYLSDDKDRKPNIKIDTSNNDKNESEIRITFLVNVWINHKPAGVNKLPEEIRTAVIASTNDGTQSDYIKLNNNITFHNYPIQHVQMNNVGSLPQSLQGYISLPFVGGKDTTWTDDNDDESEALIVRTYPPQLQSVANASTILIQFTNPDMEAYLDYASNHNETVVDEICNGYDENEDG